MTTHSHPDESVNGLSNVAEDDNRLARSALRSGIVMLATTAAVGYSLQLALELSDLFAAKALVICLLGLTLLLASLPAHLPHRRFGAANQVTMVRAALVALLFALVGEDAATLLGWSVVAIATLSAALDGVDGWLARRQRMASAFGARFDMETDALLILALCMLAWQLGKCGAWVLLAGLMRYLFVVGGYAFDWLRHPLPASTRRKTICVIQVVSLILCLIPTLTPPWSDRVAAAGLLLLGGSFFVDILWLARQDLARKEIIV